MKRSVNFSAPRRYLNTYLAQEEARKRTNERENAGAYMVYLLAIAEGCGPCEAMGAAIAAKRQYIKERA